ncbi:hypothetical protein JOQ06_013250 [Pogonophryne albipinna]|uniref:Uncharacterized protein n=1 Tax=Pogonophryne albipinna TaxID=1090488 RepID=A0AAD6BIQ6_9TELE|nr:hypothetical protein JOQ06_013250 [Pogonophryne albipinna]
MKWETSSDASTVVSGGKSAAAGALSSPRWEQLTAQDGRGPAGVQLQLTGQGLQLRPPSPAGPEPHAPRQQSTTSRLEKKLSPGTQTPCFRLVKVCPFPQGIAHSHLIASDGVSPLSLGRNTILKTKANTRVPVHGSHVRGDNTRRRDSLLDTVSSTAFSSLLKVPLLLKI